MSAGRGSIRRAEGAVNPDVHMEHRRSTPRGTKTALFAPLDHPRPALAALRETPRRHVSAPKLGVRLSAGHNCPFHSSSARKLSCRCPKDTVRTCVWTSFSRACWTLSKGSCLKADKHVVSLAYEPFGHAFGHRFGQSKAMSFGRSDTPRASLRSGVSASGWGHCPPGLSASTVAEC